MFTTLHNFFGGSSPITGYLGTAIMILTIANQSLVEGGVPKDMAGWIGFAGSFITGLALRFAKDANKSNAPVPSPTPTTVPSV